MVFPSSMSRGKNKDRNLCFSDLVTNALQGLSPIQTIMKMTEPEYIASLGFASEDIISFGGGWCNHASPPELQQIYQEIVSDKTLFHASGRYSAIKGNLSCRKQLCRFEETVYQVPEMTPDQVLIGQSATQLFHDVIRVLINPGEPVCVMDPTYANYVNGLKCALPESPLWFVPGLDPISWEYLSDPSYSLEVLESYCKQGARVFVVSTPDNPTSQIPPDDFINDAYELIEKYNGFFIVDYAYKELCFDQEPVCQSWSPGDFPHFISIHSHSKWLSSLGRRFGWVEANEKVIEGLEKIDESTILSADTLNSMATERFIEHMISQNTLRTYIDDIKMLYKHTAQVFTKCLKTCTDWKYLDPMGGLYTCCPTPNNQDPLSFAQTLLKETGVLVIPGLGFGPSLSKGIRLSYGPLCTDHEKIKEGMQRIQSYLSK